MFSDLHGLSGSFRKIFDVAGVHMVCVRLTSFINIALIDRIQSHNIHQKLFCNLNIIINFLIWIFWYNELNSLNDSQLREL